ncbi:hypothetical protein ScPMuIL_009261 [Solemya velum]
MGALLITDLDRNHVCVTHIPVYLKSTVHPVIGTLIIMPKGGTKNEGQRRLVVPSGKRLSSESSVKGKKSSHADNKSLQETPLFTSTPIAKTRKPLKNSAVKNLSISKQKSIGVHTKQLENHEEAKISKTESEENLDRLCETLSLVRSPQQTSEIEFTYDPSLDTSNLSASSDTLNRSDENVTKFSSVVQSVKTEDISEIESRTVPSVKKKKQSRVYSEAGSTPTPVICGLQRKETGDCTTTASVNVDSAQNMPTKPGALHQMQPVTSSPLPQADRVGDSVDGMGTVSPKRMPGRKRRKVESVTMTDQSKPPEVQHLSSCDSVSGTNREKISLDGKTSRTSQCSNEPQDTTPVIEKEPGKKHITVKMNFTPNRRKSDKMLGAKRKDSPLKLAFTNENSSSPDTSKKLTGTRKSSRPRKPTKSYREFTRAISGTEISEDQNSSLLQRFQDEENLTVDDSEHEEPIVNDNKRILKSKKKTPKKRKKKKLIMEESEEEESPVKEENAERRTCKRCGKMFMDMAGLKSHLMFIHSALWTKSCPEGSMEHAALMTVIRKTGKLHCPKCNKELHFLHYYYNHLSWCGRENEMFICEVCKRYVKLRWEKMHYRSHEIREMELEVKKEKLAKGMDSKNLELTFRGSAKRSAAKKAESLLQEFAEHGEQGENAVTKTEKLDPDSVPHFGSDSESDDTDVDLRIENPTGSGVRRTSRARNETTVQGSGDRYLNCLKDTINLMTNLYNTEVYDQFQPLRSHWKKMNPSDHKDYLPKYKENLDFSIKCSKEEESLQRLKLFEARGYANDSYCMNVGGPVWGLAWCPVPVSQSTHQYVAVTCNPEMEKTHPTHHNFSAPGLLQIWNLGLLSVILKPDTVPEFVLGVGHDSGCVRDVKWCPSGCWQSPNTHKETADFLPRLGLLAMACTDGTVRIYSIPHPESLSKDKSTSTCLYKPAPTISLVPYGLQKNKEKIGCACCVAWQLGNKHRYMSVGYSNGVVRLWDLCTSSTLLRIESPLELKPFKSFVAHQRSVYDTTWSPHLPNYFVTCGPDRHVKVWNVENTSVPHFIEKFSSVTSVVWPINTCGVLLATDHCFG